MGIILDSNVSCAGCGEDYLHQIGFIWYQRDEDAENGDAYFVTYGGHGSRKFTNNDEPNPSLRRHGSIVAFSCECCHAITGVHFAQHKGMTFIETRVIDDRLIQKSVSFAPNGDS